MELLLCVQCSVSNLLVMVIWPLGIGLSHYKTWYNAEISLCIAGVACNESENVNTTAAGSAYKMRGSEILQYKQLFPGHRRKMGMSWI